MNRKHQEQWIDEVLREVFAALITWEALRSALVFKGARILNLHLGGCRQSMDIDCNISSHFVETHPDNSSREAFLAEHFPKALRRHFESQTPVRFSLNAFKIAPKPPSGHPRGWDAFHVRIQVRDSMFEGVKGMPTLQVDLAAPEQLGERSVELLAINGVQVKVYSLHRIAGEKLRAYLTSLPNYRRRSGQENRDVRVKDLHDLARIVRARPLSDLRFWTAAGHEFQLACAMRLVDCQGLETFRQNWSQVRTRYMQDASLFEVTFEEAEKALDGIVAEFGRQGLFPMEFQWT